MPAFGAVLGLSSQALFFEVTTEKTDKSQAVGGRGIPPFKERRVGHEVFVMKKGRGQIAGGFRGAASEPFSVDSAGGRPGRK